uniref:Uncharacterized protein n=1 Tax=Siphoviridae sp. ctOCb13 TaxID=2825477 RepID=A0A8S5Q0F7_9CAUD|nr:MAG TPA: hypothetical protein [Siphoviridae sp. ctOCb13]
MAWHRFKCVKLCRQRYRFRINLPNHRTLFLRLCRP